MVVLEGIFSVLGWLLVLILPVTIYVGYPALACCLGWGIWRLLRKKQISGTWALTFSALTSIALLTLPFWDYLPTKRKLEKYTAEEGGTTIFRTVVGVEGIHGDAAPSSVFSLGYCYYERPMTGVVNSGKYLRGYKHQKRKIVAETTPYGVRSSKQQIDGMIFKGITETYVVSTGEVLGRNVLFYSRPLNESGISINDFRFWMRMGLEGSGPYQNFRDLLLRSLVPAEQCTE